MPETPLPAVRARELRDRLEAERARLRSQLAEIGGLAFDEGFADSGQVTAEKSEVDALAGTLRENLRDVEDALAKLDAGTYGTCERCSGPIGEARLEAMPAARRCIACASVRD